ncbi:hypothetical protein Tco_0268648 [Tanacetum coccineum]
MGIYTQAEGAQGGREAEVFQVSNDDTAMAQRRLKDNQPTKRQHRPAEKEHEKEYQTGWKIKTGNVLNSCNQRSTQQCTKSRVAKHLGVAGLQQQNGLVKETNVTLLLSTGFRFSLVIQRLKTPIDMLGIFSWLASIKQGMLEPVKVKCIFLGYRKGVVGTVQSGVQRDEFEVEPQDGHTFEVEPHGNVDHVVGSHEVQTQGLIDHRLARDREQHSSRELYSCCEVISNEGWMKDDMDARLDVIHNEKLVYILLKGHSILSLEGSLSGDYDVEKNGKWSCIYAVGNQEYQVVCTRLDIASADVGMWIIGLDYDTDVQVFVDFDYAMGRSITSGVYDTYWGLEEGNMAKGTFGRVWNISLSLVVELLLVLGTGGFYSVWATKFSTTKVLGVEVFLRQGAAGYRQV